MRRGAIVLHEHSSNHNGCGHSRGGNKKGLTVALVITLGVMVAELAGGWLTNSLALLSDAGHMLGDAGALALSLLAARFAARPASPRKSYGYRRFEVLAALANGVTLLVIAGLILWEAGRRFAAPPVVASGPMMAVAFVGLAANAASAWVLLHQGDVKGNINLRGAYLHVIGDAFGSLGALAAGWLMREFSWYVADPVISAAVAALIVKSAWGLTAQSVHILLEGAPDKADAAALAGALAALDGVVDVHDVHVWTVTPGYEVFTCHMLVRRGLNPSPVVARAASLLERRFGLCHTTIQAVEEDAAAGCRGCRDGGCVFAAGR